MKQKLLNSFTWRGTLLVALLCTAFGNAWGQDLISTTTDITWGGDVTSNNQYVQGSTYTLSASFPGFIKKVTINAKSSNKNNCKAATTVKVDNTSIGLEQTINATSYKDYVFSNNNDAYTTSISITFVITGKQQNYITVNSITVEYTPAATIYINPDCEYNSKYYGTYSDSRPFINPTSSGLTVSEVSVDGGILAVSPLSGVIPAETGVLVSSESSGNKYVKLADPNPENPYDDPTTNNMLVASSVEMSGSDSYFYHLTFNASNPLGFYWGAEGGVAWNFSGTNKAYLKVPKTDSGYSVKGFTMNDMANGIKAVETEADSKVIYNLAGQRVNKMQKGIYVVNGKKMLVK